MLMYMRSIKGLELARISYINICRYCNVANEIKVQNVNIIDA